jgi:hypothetical protein
MVPRSRDRESRVRRRGTDRRLEFDVVESRVLLSAGPQLDTTAAHAAVVQHAAATLVSGQQPTVSNQAKFLARAYADGKAIAYSSTVRKVGVSYAKLAFSSDATKVGLAYLRAVIRGEGKTIEQLNHTRLVKKVGNDFTQLSRSPFVKWVGNGFSHFGQAVAGQFNHLFLHQSSTPTAKKTT